jgi:hypothetical protein
MKLPGVESAEVSLKTASTDITLKADNGITIARLRDVLRKSGYPTREAQIVARGRIVDRGGTLVLDLLNGSALPIDPNGVASKVTGQTVEVTGVCHGDGKSPDHLTIHAIR